jgi:hypothetical protein
VSRNYECDGGPCSCSSVPNTLLHCNRSNCWPSLVTLQEWYKKCKENRVYQAFMEGVRSIIRRRRRAASSQPGRRSVGSSQGRRRDDGFGSRSTVATPEGGQRRGMASVVKGARAFSPTPSSPGAGGGMGGLSRAQSPQSAKYR